MQDFTFFQHLIQGPSIEVVFYVKKNLIEQIDLSLSSTNGFKWYLVANKPNEELKDVIEEWVLSYVNQKPIPFKLPINTNMLSPFLHQVLRALTEIPFSTTLSYGQVANLIHNPKGARAVGNACGRNPFPLIIPCHRVLAGDGSIGGFSAGGVDVKRRLLDFENISLA
ncbi:MAG: MGMT family protein [Parachlamydiaceae bacterium]|nr:MGMT family protein [Parachlamydiaceae bacterium]